AAGRARDHRVVELGLGALVEGDRGAAAGAADVGEVGDLGVGVRLTADGRPLVHAVAATGALDDDAELQRALPAGVGVEAVVVGAGDHDVAAVDRATEELDAVVGAVVHLHVLEQGAVADAAQGDAVEFVVGGDVEARMLHPQVLHHAGVVAWRVAAVEAVGTFDLLLALRGAGDGFTRAGVDRRAAEQHQATPQADRVLAGFALDVGARGERDRVVGRAFGVDLRTAVDDQQVGAGGAVQGHARLDREDALLGTGQRRIRIAATVVADGDAAADRVDRAVALRDHEVADHALGQAAGTQAAVGHGADVGKTLGAVGGRTVARRRRGRRRGRRRRRRRGGRRREGAFARRRDAIGAATAGGEGEHRAESHEQGLGTVAHGHLWVSGRNGLQTQQWNRGPSSVARDGTAAFR